MQDFSQYAEVRECGQRYCNQLLAWSESPELMPPFKLLAIVPMSYEQRRQAPAAAATFIRHDVRYIIGRKLGDPPFPDFARPDQAPPTA